MDETNLNEPTTMTVYRRADGERIWGEYAYVHDLEFFENEDEPVKLIKELWILGGRRRYTYRPPHLHDDEEYGDPVG